MAMGTSPLSETKLEEMVKEVDGQVADLQKSKPEKRRLAINCDPRLGPEFRNSARMAVTGKEAPAQAAVIERETGNPFPAFWRRYLQQAKNDLCLPGGKLHAQWSKWQKLESKLAVTHSYKWVSAMGYPMHSWQPLTVAATVFVLNAALDIGIKTLCADCVRELEHLPPPQRLE